MAALYNHHTVIGSRIRVKSLPATTAVEDPYRVTTWIADSSTLTISGVEIPMQPYASSRICSGQNPTIAYTTQNFSLKRNFKGNISNSLFRATGSASPAEQQYFVVSVTALDGGTSSVTVSHDIDIEYIVLWTERKQIAV